jgi:hypothetical protein
MSKILAKMQDTEEEFLNDLFETKLKLSRRDRIGTSRRRSRTCTSRSAIWRGISPVHIATKLTLHHSRAGSGFGSR